MLINNEWGIVLKITVIGDSITEYNYRAKKNWVMYLDDINDTKIQNLGISGTGFAKKDPYINRIGLINGDVELIGVAVSFNDLNTELPIGEIDDFEEKSLMGYLNRFVAKLLEINSDKKIIFYVQNVWSMYRPGKSRSDEYISKVEQVCQRKNIDFYTEMYYEDKDLRPWEWENRLLYFTSDNEELGDTGLVDDVHPNSEGHRVIAKKLRKYFGI